MFIDFPYPAHPHHPLRGLYLRGATGAGVGGRGGLPESPGLGHGAGRGRGGSGAPGARGARATREATKLGRNVFFLGGGVSGIFVLRWIWNEFLIYLEVFIIVIL